MGALDSAVNSVLFQEVEVRAKAQLQKVIMSVAKKATTALSDESKPEVKWFNIVRDLVGGAIQSLGKMDSAKEQELFGKIFKGVAKELSKTHKFIKPDLIKEDVNAESELELQEEGVATKVMGWTDDNFMYKASITAKGDRKSNSPLKGETKYVRIMIGSAEVLLKEAEAKKFAKQVLDAVK